MTTHYAHTLESRPPEEWEPLEAHLRLTAEGAGSFPGAAGFAEAFGCRDWGRVLGLWHDLGKYSAEFQARLRAAEGGEAHLESQGRKVDHSTAGAQHARNVFSHIGTILAHCIAGHHAGLLDQVDAGTGTGGTLSARLKKQADGIADALAAAPEAIRTAPDLSLPAFQWLASVRARSFQVGVWCRMLYSCLVDADYLATERFVCPDRSADREQVQPGIQAMRTALEAHLAALMRKAAATAGESNEVNRQRRAVLEACQQAAAQEPGLFSLTVPTGGGKTLSSLAFALKHAEQHSLRRVVYAIPFTSIIEQNADVFRRALGEVGERAVLEHHSNFEPTREDRWARLATENWDAPLIVTTNVQLFESLFANRPSRCRKLHRIARSVIVLDEVQTLPVELLTPTLAMLQELCRNYGCTVVLCSATQPAVAEREDFAIGLTGVREIVPDVPALFQALKRVEVELLGKRSDEAIVEQLAGPDHEQVLCVVNTRAHAAELFRRLTEREAIGVLHLSASMCPQHRTAVLRLIHRRLRRGEPCRVVSTQLIEAGVDVDFPVVFRSLAGLDSIAQAAGRCNREGRRPVGRVYVFEPEATPPPFVKLPSQQTREVARQHGDALSLTAIEDYFMLHYWQRQDDWDKQRIMDQFDKDGQHMQFRTTAEKYRLIDHELHPVIVPFGRAGRELARQIEQLADRPDPSHERRLRRRAQRFTVGVHDRAYRALNDGGSLIELADRFSILANPAAYDQHLGLLDRVVNWEASELVQ